MSLVPTYHSALNSDRKVYHDSSLCTEGSNIEPKNRRAGTGGRPRCERCADCESQVTSRYNALPLSRLSHAL